LNRTIPKQVLSKRRKYFKNVKQQMRYSFFVKGELKCAVCDAEDDLVLHHIIPLAIGGTNDINNLMPLCRAHHVIVHNDTKDMEWFEWQKISE